MILFIDYLARAGLFLFFPLLIVDFIVIDRLLRWEYVNAKKAWTADGRPHGYFWVPPESAAFGGLLVSLRSSRALRSITVEWLFKTPNWMSKHKRARLLLWLHRLLVSAIYLPLIGLLVLAVFQ